ncbi:helix-turn-helix domain-containing protein [Prosthecobacter sp.]|uniref:helix-turn-helix domain-containing protein n=1 Tax=Prosthecobacter sp. TaxID=1965333 RepID=UPI003783E894
MTHETPSPLPPEIAASAPVTIPVLTQPTAASPAPAEPPAPAVPHTLVPAPAPAAAFLTMRQLAAALGVSRRTLTTWNQRRIIPSVRVGRVRRYELEQVRHALRTHGQPDSGMHIPAGPAAAF